MFIINSAILSKLLIALNECSEWGRVAILNCLARYKAQDDKESEHICERVMPQFQHANGSVVLTAVRVRCIVCIFPCYPAPNLLLGSYGAHADGDTGRFDQPTCQEDGTTTRYVTELDYSLPYKFTNNHSVTLVSAEHEVQWVALRNINLLLQKRSDILQNEMRVFFCKYNDPPYIKVEKLDVMIRLAQEKNVDALLSELKE